MTWRYLACFIHKLLMCLWISCKSDIATLLCIYIQDLHNRKEAWKKVIWRPFPQGVKPNAHPHDEWSTCQSCHPAHAKSLSCFHQDLTICTKTAGLIFFFFKDITGSTDKKECYSCSQSEHLDSDLGQNEQKTKSDPGKTFIVRLKKF